MGAASYNLVFLDMKLKERHDVGIADLRGMWLNWSYE